MMGQTLASSGAHSICCSENHDEPVTVGEEECPAAASPPHTPTGLSLALFVVLLSCSSSPDSQLCNLVSTSGGLLMEHSGPPRWGVEEYSVQGGATTPHLAS